MASLGKTVIKGGSGKTYRFRVYPLGTKFRKISGVYVITNRYHNEGTGYRHKTLYIGQTEDFSMPIDRHDKAQEFMQHGANCICVQSDASEDSRTVKAQDLVAALHPRCNG
ncbi:MAG: hypothetical protein JXB10_20595 [Pirellulales bacterium]|nr:hypothetical protein [Pirellulales bacterium]